MSGDAHHIKRAWSSGYDVCLTRRRSRVRSSVPVCYVTLQCCLWAFQYTHCCLYDEMSRRFLWKAGLVVTVGELYCSGQDVILNATVPSQSNRDSVCGWCLIVLRWLIVTIGRNWLIVWAVMDNNYIGFMRGWSSSYDVCLTRRRSRVWPSVPV